MHSICGTVRAPRCHLIHHLPSHQSPTPSPVGPLQRGNQRSLPERKTQKKVKRSSPMFMNRSTQFTKDRKTRASLSVPLWPIHTHPGKKEGGQSNCRLQISCDRFFIWDRINQISQLCPHVHHLPPIPLCRLHSWRQRAWLSIQTFLTVIYYRYRVPPSILPGQYLWEHQHISVPYWYLLPYTHISLRRPHKLKSLLCFLLTFCSLHQTMGSLWWVVFLVRMKIAQLGGWAVSVI